MSDIELKNTAYEEAYQNLRGRYIERLKNSIEAIDNILRQKQLAPLSKEDLLRAQHMAHGLAGSGAVFGFPAITESGHKADTFLEKTIRGLPADAALDDEKFKDLENLMLALRQQCHTALHTEDNKPIIERATGTPQVKMLQTFHVHIVDDDAHLGDLLSLKLRQKNVRVTVSGDGKAAMTAIRKSAPDLIILDISMPEMSGHEVLRQLKQDPEFLSIPILMLTGQADQKDVVSALHSGALDYILKPFDPDKLIARIEKILDAARYNILIADNDPLILQLLDTKFRHAGFKVTLLNDGKKAWDKIMRDMPDLVILDRMMPGLEGLNVLKNMREEKSTKNIPVIILSARKEDRDIELGLKMGAQDYIVKPFLPDDLLSTCLKLLKEEEMQKMAAS